MSTTEPREPRESGQQREQREPRPTTQAYTTGSPGSRAEPTARPSSPSPSSPSPSSPSSAPSGTASTAAAGAQRDRTSSGIALAVAALVLGLLLGAFGMSLIADDDSGASEVLAGNIDPSRYQAVILVNDKVYFGRLSVANDAFFRLDDAFFLRETRENPDADPVRTLLPVNRELHAPENSMLIRQDEVVLIEDLDEESPVLEEIKRQTEASEDEPPTSDSGER